MGVVLQKGQKVNISSNERRVSKITVGLGWNPNTQSSRFPFDLDASAFLLNQTGKVDKDDNFIFYNNPLSLDGAVCHSGNNTTGRFNGDAEQIDIDLDKLSSSIDRIAVSITINEAQQRNQTFGMINKAYVRIINNDNNDEVIYFDLSSQFTNETAIVAAEIYRYKDTWKFNAIGAGFHGGLAALCRNFGVSLAEESPSYSNVPTPSHSNMPVPNHNYNNYGNSNHNNQYNSQYSNTPQISNNSYNNSHLNNQSFNNSSPNQQGLLCPFCHSGSVTAGKKGFGVGKAAVGTLLLGPIGLLGGFMGSNNLEFACLSCGKKWMAQSNSNTLAWLSQQANNTKNIVNKYIGGDFVDSLIAACSIVAMADGILEQSEKAKLMQFFSTSNEFRSLNLYEVEQKFNYYAQKIQYDSIMGRAEALRIVSKQRTKPDAARMIARLCCAIGYADGDFGHQEKRAIEEICRELGLNPAEFIGY